MKTRKNKIILGAACFCALYLVTVWQFAPQLVRAADGVGRLVVSKLSDLTGDTAIAAPAKGQSFAYNGTKWGNLRGAVNILSYGAKGDGVTDDTAAFQSWWSDAYAGTCSKALYVPDTGHPYLILGQLLEPDSGSGSGALTKAFTIFGDGAWNCGGSIVAQGGTMLDLRYSGAGGTYPDGKSASNAKIDLRGVGSFTSFGVNYIDNGTDSNPFIITRGTTPFIHHCRFQGNPSKGGAFASGATNDQDAILFGGASPALDGSGFAVNDYTANAPYSGYGAIIGPGVVFDRVRCAARFRALANGVQFVGNTIQGSCGAPGSQELAVEGVDLVHNSTGGVVIAQNLIQTNNLTDGGSGLNSDAIRLSNASQCSIVNNNFYDMAASARSCVRIESGCVSNYIVLGVRGNQTISDADSTFLTSKTQCYDQKFGWITPLMVGINGITSKPASVNLNLASAGPFIVTDGAGTPSYHLKSQTFPTGGIWADNNGLATGFWEGGYATQLITGKDGAALSRFGVTAQTAIFGDGIYSQLAAGGVLVHIGPTSTSKKGLAVNLPNGSTVNAAEFGVNGVVATAFDSTGNFNGNAPQVFNVQAPKYGAVGNGVADDTTAIQNAATAALAAKGVLYFPAGTYLVTRSGGATSPCITLTAGLKIVGAGRELTTIKTKASTGNYRAVFSGVANDLTGLWVEGITFDQNSANNAISAAPDLTTTNQARYAVEALVGSRLTVKDCRFTGYDSMNVVTFNTASGTDFFVENCIFDNGGNATIAHDHSDLYLVGSGMTVRGNTCIGNTANRIATVCAIETHGDGQTVTGNRVRDYKVGGNLTGVASTHSAQVVWSHNEFRNVAIGIQLYSQTGASGTDPGLTDVEVVDNLITQDFGNWNAANINPSGIALSNTSDLGTRNVRIARNTIRLTNVSGVLANNATSAGILWQRLTGKTDTNLSIDENEIDGAISSGIYFGPGTCNGLSIQHNRLRNVGQGGTSAYVGNYNVGMLLVGTIADAQIDGNAIIDDQGTHSITQGIDSSNVTTATNCEATSNTLRVADGTNITPFVPAAGAGAAFFVDYRVGTFVNPGGNIMAGSKVTETSTGTVRIETAAGTGSTWTALTVP